MVLTNELLDSLGIEYRRKKADGTIDVEATPFYLFVDNYMDTLAELCRKSVINCR